MNKYNYKKNSNKKYLQNQKKKQKTKQNVL